MALFFLLVAPFILNANPLAEAGKGVRLPGSATAVYFRPGPASLHPLASGFQQKAAFYFEALNPGSGRQIALLAIPLAAKPGLHQVKVSWLESGIEASETLEIAVGSRPGAAKKITLPDKAVQAAVNLVMDKRRISDALSSAQGPPLWRGSFASPLRARRLSEGFGVARRYLPLGRLWRHKGLDFPADIGSPVSAANDGVVVLAEENLKAYGGVVVISHGYELCSSYLHLSSIHVKAGENVKKGALIALSGDKGISTGPHLHWQLDLRGHPVDPLPWMDKTEAAGLR